MMVERLQHQTALELTHQVRADLFLSQPPCLFCNLEDARANRFFFDLGLRLQPFSDRRLQLVFGLERGFKTRHIPLFLDRLRRNIAFHRRLDFAANHVLNGLGDVFALQ